MDNNVPTAEDFFLKRSKELHSDPEDMPGWMIEEAKNLAKLHVEAALKTASKKSIMLLDLGENEEGNFVTEKLKSYNDEDGCPIYIDKDSILNAYPLTNIK